MVPQATGASTFLPQWSRSRRSGATLTLTGWPSAPSRLNGAAPEGAERRPPSLDAFGFDAEASMEPLPKGSDAEQVLVVPGLQLASMEPLPKERSDDGEGQDDAASRPCLNGAAPEGAERRGPAAHSTRSRSGLNGAAPEGAERRAASTGRRSAGGCLNGAAPEGAERRSVGPGAMSPPWSPQWSRSRRSGATNSTPLTSMSCRWPQWSRSRRSGATSTG